MVFKCCCFLMSVFVLFCVCLCSLCSVSCSLTLGFLCFSLCTVSHLPSHSVLCSWSCPCVLCLVHSWILSCNLPLLYSLSLSFKKALYYRACPTGKTCSSGEWRQGNGPALEQQTIYWHLLGDIVRSTLIVILWSSVF